jgi:hypothetical protein
MTLGSLPLAATAIAADLILSQAKPQLVAISGEPLGAVAFAGAASYPDGAVSGGGGGASVALDNAIQRLGEGFTGIRLGRINQYLQ